MTKKTAIYSSTGRLKRVLLGKPEYNEVMPLSDVARDLHDAGRSFDRALQFRQHAEMESVFQQLGIAIEWVELDPKLPWGMFTRDFGVNTPQGVLLGRFRYSERKGEEVRAKESLDELGEKVLPEQILRGCMEGGDCYWLNEETLVIGNGNRSTYAGYENAKEILAKYGLRVFVVEFLSKWNHLDIIFQPVAEKLAVACEDAIPDYFFGFLDALGWEVIRVAGEHAMKTEINMLALGDDRVLSFKGNRLNEMLRARGLQVFDPEYSCFTAMGGGVHCSTFELERDA
ncbi:MAG: arginine deiminase family protein [Anaerolineales bacterium]